MKNNLPKPPKKIIFLTLGCKVNQYETQSIREAFIKRGYLEAGKTENSPDYCLINTCTVTSAADRKSYQLIRRCAKEYPKSKIIVTGCMVTSGAAKLAGIRGVSLIVGKNFFPQKISDFKNHTRAFVKIQDGCNNFCSYCKVPLARGRSRSRRPVEIINDTLNLAAKGFKEIVLTGICLGSYGKDLKPRTDLPALIKQLEKIEGIIRIRLSSIEAGDVSDNLISLIAKSKKLCPHLHIPIQSGDDGILKRMNRKYSSKDYLALVNKLKKKIPRIAITTDVLVGFPGENDVNSRNTARLLRKIKPLKVHIFPYSEREGTTASFFSGKVNPVQINRRIMELKQLSLDLSKKYKEGFVNKEIKVLIERRLSRNPGLWEGFTDNYMRITVESERELKNQLIPLRIKGLDKVKFCLTKPLSSPKI